jgi:hypothetical protein
MKQTMGMSLAVMALLNNTSAVEVKRHHSPRHDRMLAQIDDLDTEEGDQFMAESIKEAEEEYKKK